METPATPSPNQVSLRVNLKWVVLLLVAVIVVMLFVWRPWSAKTSGDRTVKVTGEVTLKSEPDEFVFYPSYNFKDADKAKALADLTAKSDQIVTKLKTLGLNDSQIKTNANGNDYISDYYYSPATGENNYTLSLTITVDNKTKAQKVQDYLVTTTPTGSVTPQANFSDKKQKELESQARDQATKDARSKVDQEAKNLGFKVGKVKSVEDGTGFGAFPLEVGAALDSAKSNVSNQLTVQTGQNDLSYSVTVTYFIH